MARIRAVAHAETTGDATAGGSSDMWVTWDGF